MVEFLLLALLVIVGHFGWWLYWYNRINATGLPRRLIKRIELVIIALCLLIPTAFAVVHWSALAGALRGEAVDGSSLSPLLGVWALGSMICALVLGPLWLESRAWLWPPRNVLQQREERLDVAKHVTERLTGDRLTERLSRLPLNEITCLSISQKTLQLERSFSHPWRQLTIGHMSDLHFTGGLTPAYYHYVVDRMQALEPDLIAVTGDIVDTNECLEWLAPILGRLRAPLGCYFVLGNHERRLTRPQAVAERLCELGWNDVGARSVRVDAAGTHELPGRPSLIVCGNERPWFERHEGNDSLAESIDAADGALRLGLAHSPDQYGWARELGVDLLLAGHTHGGQIRIPGLGPLVAPSWYGSRFASGVFRLPPTLMHVSRGLAGTQPLRWRCLPEISLLSIVPKQTHSLPAKPAALRQPGEPSLSR